MNIDIVEITVKMQESERFLRKNLRISKICSTFAVAKVKNNKILRVC